MGYQKALELAGAKVHCFEEFGSYQGDWWAKVTYNGETGWVHGNYGSCSACDAFAAEFGFEYIHKHEDGSYVSGYDSDEFDNNCKKCAELRERMIDFGKSYLEPLLTQEQAEEMAAEDLDWDLDAIEMLKFIKENGIKSNRNFINK